MALILGATKGELAARLDTPLGPVGDLYYINNLVSTLEAGGTAPPPPPPPKPPPPPGGAPPPKPASSEDSRMCGMLGLEALLVLVLWSRRRI